jgi:serine/threonine-protein kinase
VEDRRDAMEMFIREAKIAAALSHPNIVTVTDFGVDRDSDGRLLYIEMPLIEGGDLQSVLRACPDRRLPVDVALFVGAEFLRGLDYAHRRAVIYRDVKASNVLVTFDGHIQLADLGIARLAHMAPTRRMIKGTLGYIAPELYDMSTPATARSDIFGFAVLLYRALTGHALFSARTFQEAERVVRAGEVPPLSDFGVKAPRELESLLRRCLSVDPAARPAGAAETRVALLDVPGARKTTTDDLAAFLRDIGFVAPSERETETAAPGELEDDGADEETLDERPDRGTESLRRSAAPAAVAGVAPPTRRSRASFAAPLTLAVVVLAGGVTIALLTSTRGEGNPRPTTRAGETRRPAHAEPTVTPRVDHPLAMNVQPPAATPDAGASAAPATPVTIAGPATRRTESARRSRSRSAATEKVEPPAKRVDKDRIILPRGR